MEKSLKQVESKILIICYLTCFEVFKLDLDTTNDQPTGAPILLISGWSPVFVFGKTEIKISNLYSISAN
jgi:hypothetical protein